MPWTAYRPDWATPNARALVSGRSACTNVDGLGGPAFVMGPGLAGLGPDLRCHGLARAQASARVAFGVWPVSPSSMQLPPVVQ